MAPRMPLGYYRERLSDANWTPVFRFWRYGCSVREVDHQPELSPRPRRSRLCLTAFYGLPTLESMEVHLNNPDLQAKIDQWVEETGRPADELVADAVAGYFGDLLKVRSES
jgi:hypothetical protein